MLIKKNKGSTKTSATPTECRSDRRLEKWAIAVGSNSFRERRRLLLTLCCHLLIGERTKMSTNAFSKGARKALQTVPPADDVRGATVHYPMRKWRRKKNTHWQRMAIAAKQSCLEGPCPCLAARRMLGEGRSQPSHVQERRFFFSSSCRLHVSDAPGPGCRTFQRMD